ncbi:hypothetical protein J2X12_003951 [Pseudarthrobacter oxydans]|jgi:hypothetical protein|uniref:Uncharacterized protein n=1 Tax=Pseudarthrobacter oxydans TaxID=1671 RepID=A0AAW8NEY9_PSEOX|nr:MULTISPECIES: hypothetical protein [Micrococcaceae]MDR7165897.1 hypothetical protein [Pseudarthrobacter oxydans]
MEPVVIDGGKGTVQLGADGIISLVWKPGIVLESDDVHSAMTTVNEISGEFEYPMLVDMGTTKAVTRQAKSAFQIPVQPSGSPCWAQARLTASSPTSPSNGRHCLVQRDSLHRGRRH